MSAIHNNSGKKVAIRLNSGSARRTFFQLLRQGPAPRGGGWRLCAVTSTRQRSCEMLSLRVPLTDSVAQCQATNSTNMLGCDKFKAGSSRWLEKFKKKHTIVCKVLCGESLSADVVRPATWQEQELKGILGRYQPRYIYNADVTVLFLPDDAWSYSDSEGNSGMRSKQWFSILFRVKKSHVCPTLGFLLWTYMVLNKDQERWALVASAWMVCHTGAFQKERKLVTDYFHAK